MRKASKKVLLTVLLTLVCAVSFGLTGIAFAAGDVSYVNPDSPELGSNDAAAIFAPAAWAGNSFGTKRKDYETTEIVVKSAWGTRGTFVKPVNVTDFSFSLNVANMKPGTCVGMQISAAPDGFPTVSTGINIEIIRSATEEHGYGVTIGSAKNGHNNPYTETNVDALWDTYYGIPFIGENQLMDDTVDIAIKKVDANFVFTVEGTDYTVPEAVANIDGCLGEDFTACHMSFFAFNNDNLPQSFIFTNYRDADIDAYLAAGGAYETVTGQIDAYVALADGDLSTAEKISAAVASKKLIELSNLYSYDQAFVAARIAAADAKVQAAIDSNNGSKIAIAETDAEAYATAVASSEAIDTVAELKAAVALKTAAEASIAVVDAIETPSGDESAQIAAIKESKAASDVKLQAGIDTVMTGLVNAYAAKADDLAGLAKLLAAKDAKAAIDGTLYGMVSETAKAALDETITAVDAKVLATQTLAGWTVAGNALVSVKDNQIEMATMGGWASNALVYGQKFDATNFKMQIQFDKMGGYNTSWYSFGLMEKAEPFNNNDDQTVQENKGLFFFVIPTSATKAKIEIYQISLLTNRFFDALKTETLEVDLSVGGTLDIDITTFTKELAGKTEEYLKITIGGKTMQTDLIKVSALKTSLGSDNKGYLVLCSTGDGTYPWQATVKTINDKNATASDITTPVDRTGGENPGESEQPTENPSEEPTPAGCGCGTVGPMSSGGIGGMIGGLMVLAAGILTFFTVKKSCLKRNRN